MKCYGFTNLRNAAVQFSTGLTLSVIAVLGAVGVAPGTASAAEGWQAVVNWDSRYRCTPGVANFKGVEGLTHWTCVIIATGGWYAQSVAIFKNTSSGPIGISAKTKLLIEHESFESSCAPSQLGAGTRRACYGDTKHVPVCGTQLYAVSTGNVAGRSYTASSNIERVCD